MHECFAIGHHPSVGDGGRVEEARKAPFTTITERMRDPERVVVTLWHYSECHYPEWVTTTNDIIQEM